MDNPIYEKLIGKPTTAFYMIEQSAGAIDIAARTLGLYFGFSKSSKAIAEHAVDIVNELECDDGYDMALQSMADLVEKHDNEYVFVYALANSEIVYAKMIMGDVIEFLFGLDGGGRRSMWVEPESVVAALETDGVLHILLDRFTVRTVN